jgi:hypothetical protein
VLDWLIIGGGVQGTYLSHWLAVARGVPRAKLRVLDPHEALLERWRHCTRNTGVDVLRSPFVHHLDLDAGSLQRYSRRFRANPQPSSPVRICVHRLRFSRSTRTGFLQARASASCACAGRHAD